MFSHVCVHVFMIYVQVRLMMVTTRVSVRLMRAITLEYSRVSCTSMRLTKATKRVLGYSDATDEGYITYIFYK